MPSAQPVGAFRAALSREVMLAARHKSEWLMGPLFFAIVVTLFAFGSSPNDPSLAAFAPAVLWVAALLAPLLTMDRLFREDYEDGTLEQLLVSPAGPVPAVLAKLLAHWMFSGLPLVMLSAPLAVQLGVQGWLPIKILLFSLLLGTPMLSLVGGFAAALTVGLPRAGLLLPVLVLPMLVPIVIFGCGAVRAAQAGLDPSGPLYFLAAMLAFTATLLPWGALGALRNAVD